MLFTLITDRNTGVILVKNKVGWTWKTFLVVPIPDFASKIWRFYLSCKITSAIFQSKSRRTTKAVSGQGVPGITVVANCNTNSISVEERSVSTFETVVIAIESFAKRVSSWDEGVRISNALALINNVSRVAGGAFSCLLIPFSAFVRYWCAYSIGIEEESDWAFKAGVLSIPGLAARIDLFSSRDYCANSIVESISLITLFADANVLVEDFALRVNFATDSFGIEVVVDWAFYAVGSFPLCTSEMVVKDVKCGGVVGDEGLDLSRGRCGCLLCS